MRNSRPDTHDQRLAESHDLELARQARHLTPFTAIVAVPQKDVRLPVRFVIVHGLGACFTVEPMLDDRVLEARAFRFVDAMDRNPQCHQ